MKDRIKEIRGNMTQDDFAETMGISKNYVSQMENGKKVPGDRLISDICEKFGYSETWLKTGVGNPKEKTLELSSTQVLLEALERDHGKPFPSMVKAIAEIYAEADEIERQVLNRLVDELLEKMK